MFPLNPNVSYVKDSWFRLKSEIGKVGTWDIYFEVCPYLALEYVNLTYLSSDKNISKSKNFKAVHFLYHF